ncbi:hypothetical protein V8Z74_01340 [Comamonas sp. w2-DMI]|uniref:hypothetical protein n=1 Tax=Comamonas sp. w2-DMI TaxID=3126391 RepID=UPI0032E4E96A
MNNEHSTQAPDINPATGLPMVDDTWLDVGGSPFGLDVYQPHYTPQPAWPPVGGGEPW